jgi:hypothetical protein
MVPYNDVEQPSAANVIIPQNTASDVSNYAKDPETGRRRTGHDTGKLPRLTQHSKEEEDRLRDSIVEFRKKIGGAIELFTGNAALTQKIAQLELDYTSYQLDLYKNPVSLADPYAKQKLAELADHYSLQTNNPLALDYAPSEAGTEDTVDLGGYYADQGTSFEPTMSTVAEE